MSEAANKRSFQSIGERIRDTRKARNMNQADLARRVGVSQPAVANWESGIHDPRRLVLTKIAQALGVSPEWLAQGARSVDELDKHPAAAYIRRQNRHVPVISLENATQLLFDDFFDPHTYAQDYIPVTTSMVKLFGVFANDEAVNLEFPENALVVVDYADTKPIDRSFYLVSPNGDPDETPILRRWREAPVRLEPASLVDGHATIHLGAQARIIGCARVSIRIH